ncbi:MAG: hypothetical protein ACHQIM_17600 [Sphingobacteriales bacterium]
MDAAPTGENLKDTNIYITVNPDTKKVNRGPHYIQEGDIEAICKQVKAGGVLAMLANAGAHVELHHFNNLAARFGICFNDDPQNHAITRYGKGTVFAFGDPWLYNEYTKGRLPPGFENDKATGDVAQ